MANNYLCFEPEVIVEVTVVCDLSCRGCYASNVFSRTINRLQLSDHPELFLSPLALTQRLREITRTIGRVLRSLSFRGGEPACHPSLVDLINVGIGHTRQLFIETHAQWLIPHKQRKEVDLPGIIKALKDPRVVLKVSFDSMHGTSADELKRMLAFLNENNVKWLVAITEPNNDAFLAQRDRCSWVPNSKIVLQPKASHPGELYVPPLGVVRSIGDFACSLSARNSF